MMAVGRRDIELFLMRLAGLASAGGIANVTHCDCVIMVRSVLRRARDRGLTAPGGLLDGLPDTFAVYESDSPQREERDPDDEVGRSLPNSVIKQLASNPALAFLELANGFQNRFLLIAVDRSKLLPFGSALDADQLAEVREAVRRGLRFAGAHRALPLDPAARER